MNSHKTASFLWWHGYWNSLSDLIEVDMVGEVKLAWLIGSDFPYQRFMERYVTDRGFSVRRFYTSKECRQHSVVTGYEPELIIIMDLQEETVNGDAYESITGTYEGVSVLHLSTVQILAMAQETLSEEGRIDDVRIDLSAHGLKDQAKKFRKEIYDS